MLHLDVMDGHFVPNISFGMPVIASLRKTTGVYFDCHLMTTNPDAYLEDLKNAGADLVTVHIEVIPNPTNVAKKAKELGLDFGLVLSPPTPFAGSGTVCGIGRSAADHVRASRVRRTVLHVGRFAQSVHPPESSLIPTHFLSIYRLTAA